MEATAVGMMKNGGSKPAAQAVSESHESRDDQTMNGYGADEHRLDIADDSVDDRGNASEEVVLFAPAALTAILLSNLEMKSTAAAVDAESDEAVEGDVPLQTDSCDEALHVRIDKKLKVTLRDTCSAVLVFFNDDVPDSEETVYILDLMANVRKRREEFSPDSKLCAVTYQYRRLKQQFEFEVFPSQDGEEGLQNVQALDFTMSQFTIMEDQSAAARRSRNSRVDDDDDQGLQIEYDSAPGTPGDEQRNQHRPNIVARGLEGSGSVIRTALRSGGRYTGDAIRFLGKQYTSLLAPISDDDYEDDGNADEGGSNEVVQTDQPQEAVPCGDEHSSIEKSTLQEDITAAIIATREGNADAVTFSDETYASDALAPTPQLPRSDSSLSDQSGGSIKRRGTAIDPRVLARAQSHKRWAEGIHSGARTVTGTALYPVRWTGKKAAAWGKGGSDAPVGAPEDQNVLIRTISDTLGGVGNGVMSVCKGVTEALGEVGSAVGDCAMHHSTVVHGEEYAQRVTKCYVDAASEIGLAGYRVANLVALGWQGIILEAVIEGTVLAVALYDYLVGPVLLMGYVEMIQLPQTELRRFFVVLRPWSISFYKSSEDFTKKPYKIIPTSLLDTMPKLRIRSQPIPKEVARRGSNKQCEEEDRSKGGILPVRNPSDEAKQPSSSVDEEDADEMVDNEYWYRSDYDNFDTSISPVVKKFEPHLDLNKKPALLLARKSSTDLDDYSASGMQELIRKDPDISVEDVDGEEPTTGEVDHEVHQDESVQKATEDGTSSLVPANKESKRWFSVLSKWYGGNTDHIELNTIDCSSYLLYPALPATVLTDGSQRQQYEKIETHTRLWFQELKEATKRVETIAKRNSGAEEIALYRRLNMFPRSRILLITVKRFVHTMKQRSLFGNHEKNSQETPTGKTESFEGDKNNQGGSGGGWFSFFINAAQGASTTESDAANNATMDVQSPAQIKVDANFSDRVAEAIGMSTMQYADDGGDIMEGDQDITPSMAKSLLDEETYFDYEDFIFIDDDEYIEGSHADADHDHINMQSIYNDSTYVNELQRYNRQFVEPHNPLLLQEEEEPQSMGTTPCSLTPVSAAGMKDQFSDTNPLAADGGLAMRLNPMATTPPRASAVATPVAASVDRPITPNDCDAVTTPIGASTPPPSSTALGCFPRRTSKSSPPTSEDAKILSSGGKGRSIFTAKVSTTFVPITDSGIEIAPEKSTTSSVNLLRMPDYLCNISAQLNALIAQERAAEESAAAATAALPEANAEFVPVDTSYDQARLTACKMLQDNMRLYSQVSQKKLVADWESDRIFKSLASASTAVKATETIEMGRKINILADSGDCTKIRVSLRCKSNLPHYRVVGQGDIHLQDIPVINSVADAEAATAAGSTMGDIWIPIIKSRRGDAHQVGALLVNVLQTATI